MKTYIVKDADQLKIIQVAPEQEEAFEQQYAGKIILYSWSIQGVLEKYNAWLNWKAANQSK